LIRSAFSQEYANVMSGTRFVFGITFSCTFVHFEKKRLSLCLVEEIVIINEEGNGEGCVVKGGGWGGKNVGVFDSKGRVW
jgi:hypothetical protein